MTTEQIIIEILKLTKPYHHIGMAQSTFSNIVARIKAGTCKPKTIERLFNKFGYFKNPQTWIKK